MGTAPGGSTLPGGSTWGPAAGSRQKNIQARGRAGGLRHTSGRECPGEAAPRGGGPSWLGQARPSLQSQPT